MKRPATMSRPMRIWRRTEPRRRARKLLYQWIGRRGSVSAAVLPFYSLSFRKQRPPLFHLAAVNRLCILKGPLRELPASDGKIPESMSTLPDPPVLSAA